MASERCKARSGGLRAQSKWSSIALLAACEVMALALWFSVSAVIPALKSEFALDDVQVSLLTSSVAVGFVIGTLASALLGLADRLHPRRFFMVSALVAAAANGAILLFEPSSRVVIGLRFVTGMCMTGLYPIGMKMAATWAKGDTGLLVGLLVGALTLGSASPHLFNAVGGLDWRFTLVAASASAVIAGLLIHFVGLGPTHAKAPPFNPAAALRAWTDKPLRLANLGYFGHMWELYAMWGWAGVFLHASFGSSLGDAGAHAAFYAKLATFAVIGSGGAGCIFGGLIADRLGRTTLTMGAMAISGPCSLCVGFLFGGNPWALTTIGLLWASRWLPTRPSSRPVSSSFLSAPTSAPCLRSKRASGSF